MHPSPVLRTDNLEEALARMAYLIERRRPLGYLAGTSGVGKSTALSSLAEEMRAPSRRIITLSAAGMHEQTLLLACIAELGLGRSHRHAPDRQSLLIDYLIGLSANRESVAILVDDFDLADESCMTFFSSLFRRLARVEPTLSVIAAVGDSVNGAIQELGRSQAEFIVRLASWTVRESAKYTLDVMARHNRRTLGAYSIDDSGLRAIHDCSEGLPGRLVRILELSLLAGEALDETRLNAEIIRSAALELFPRPSLVPTRFQLRPVEA